MRRLPLEVWRLLHPSYFHTDEYGDTFLKETIIHPEMQSYIPIGLALQAARGTARQRLEKTADAFAWADYWLEYGRGHLPSSPDDSLRMIQNNLLGETGHCFLNSLGIGLGLHDSMRPDLRVRYVEGLAVRANGAFVHGWLTVNGRVIDATWTDSFMCSYFGVEFEIPWIDNMIKLHDRVGLLYAWEAVEEEVKAYIQAHKDSS